MSNEKQYKSKLNANRTWQPFTECITLISGHLHFKENSKQIFPEKELRGLSPNSNIHVSVCDLNIPTIGLSILLQENRWTECGNI